ncbi:MAG TPA: hypothetical protein VHD91_08045 [Gaiellaceae bacterium]|nr:hypothetical protein [Gaiellaceae bacterium]
MTLRRSRVFDASSPVTRYWLSRCVGFSVTSGGRVEAVLSDGDLFEPHTLLVRSSRHRVRRVPASAVVAVVPVQRKLVVARASRRLPRVRVDLRPAARVAGLAAAEAWRLSVLAYRAAAPVVAAWSMRAWAESVRLVASVPWHRFGPSARSATTRASQELSRRWSLLRTTSSPPSSASDSPVEANTTSSG